MVSVCFAGITGWTAPAIVAAIDRADDLRSSSGVSRSAAGQSLATAAGSASDGYVYATVAEALQSAQVDVLIDYTSAAAVKTNVWTAVRAGVHTVIGSSGLTSQDYEELDRLALTHRHHGRNILVPAVVQGLRESVDCRDGPRGRVDVDNGDDDVRPTHAGSGHALACRRQGCADPGDGGRGGGAYGALLDEAPP